MTTIDLIAASLPIQIPPEPPQIGICCITGAECLTVARKLVIKPSFTNLDLLAAPTSERAGVAAWRVMNHAPARQSLWFCDGIEFRLLKRTDLRTMVLQGAQAQYWAGYATTSYKKHGALRCPLNANGRQTWLFETLLADCSDRAIVAEMWHRMRKAQDAGIQRPLIESLDISASYIARIGYKTWIEFETWARSRAQSTLYKFIAYLLPARKDPK